jgi:hypothetical protein
MINGETIYQNRISKHSSNHASLQKRCTTLNPVKECSDYTEEYGNSRYVMALACLLPQHRPENWDNSGWSETSPEEIFGDWTLDNHPLYAN